MFYFWAKHKSFGFTTNYLCWIIHDFVVIKNLNLSYILSSIDDNLLYKFSYKLDYYLNKYRNKLVFVLY